MFEQHLKVEPEEEVEIELVNGSDSSDLPEISNETDKEGTAVGNPEAPSETIDQPKDLERDSKPVGSDEGDHDNPTVIKLKDSTPPSS